jgi:L-fucose isomerase-like protein
VTVTVIPFFSVLAAKQWVESVVQRLAAAGARVTTADAFQQEVLKADRSRRAAHNFVFVGTGGTEKAIVDVLGDARLRQPILLLSHDSSNSLPAAMETRMYLEQRGVKACIIHAPLDGLLRQIRQWCSFATIEERLGSSRIGLIGKPSSWLVASQVSPAKVRRRWGLSIEKYPLAALVDHLDARLESDLKPSLEQFTRQAVRTNVPEKELIRAGVVAQGVMRFIHSHKLDAVTVECFRLLEQTGITGCYALSRLNDLPGVVAGCEGDVPAAFTLLLAKLLTGRPAFMANVSDVDLDSNSAVFAHCTVATTMVDEYEITTHFESGKSVAIQGRVRAQPVTVLKVFGHDLSRYWVSSGVAIAHQTAANGCRTQIRVKLVESVSHFLERSLANHHVIVPGDHAQMLRDFFAFVLRE